MFENVSYNFYSDTLGRSVIPDEETFRKYELENRLYMKRLVDDNLVEEKEENGIDSAVCMMIEVDYQASQIASGEDAPDASESIGGYSYSTNNKAYEKYVEQNTKSTEEQKYKWLSLFCNVLGGVR